MSMWIKGKHFIVLGFKLTTFPNTASVLNSIKANLLKQIYLTLRHDTDKRQEALLEIVKTNKIILRRLSQCTSYYSVEGWNEQWLKTLDHMKSLGRFPPLRHVQVKYEVLLGTVLSVSHRLNMLSLHFLSTTLLIICIPCADYWLFSLLCIAICRCVATEDHGVI